MDISYVKESFLLAQNYNNEVITFKSRILDTTYLYEKNKNSDFEKNIREIQKDMENYLQLEYMKIEEKKEKGIPKYFILFFIVCFIFAMFLYIKFNKLSSYLMIFWTTCAIITTIYLYNDEYQIDESLNRNINLLDNVCNNLIYKNVKS